MRKVFYSGKLGGDFKFYACSAPPEVASASPLPGLSEEGFVNLRGMIALVSKRKGSLLGGCLFVVLLIGIEFVL